MGSGGPGEGRGSGAVRLRTLLSHHVVPDLLFERQLFVKEGGDGGSFWRLFWPTSGILLALMTLVSPALVSG